MTFEHYLAPVSTEQLAEHIAKSWSWFTPLAELEPIGLTKLADVFLRDRDGAVYFLDTSFGVLERIAASRGEFVARLENDAFARSLLRIELVDALADLTLAAGQCFGFG